MSKQVNFLDDLFSKIKAPKQQTKDQKINSDLIKQFNQSVNYISDFNNQDIYNQNNTDDLNQDGYELIKKIVKNDQKFDDKIQNKMFLIQKFEKKLDFQKSTKQDQKSTIYTNICKQREFFSIEQNAQNYNMYLPLNKLWNQYIQEQLQEIRNEKELSLKILKCDLHGCILQILNSKCKTYEGQSGIVIQETMKTFNIVNEQNKINKILKQNSIFLIQLPDQKQIKIYGCHLLQRKSQRLKNKFTLKDVKKYIIEKFDA